MLKTSFSKQWMEAGIDEVGRGCLAGPVVAAAVILPPNYKHAELKDSKKLTRKQRERLEDQIKKEALAWAIAEVSPADIDRMNIANASFYAMEKAVALLSVVPEFLIIDGNRFKSTISIPYQCIVKGDNLYLSIAAASVLAKVYRDKLMLSLAMDFPYYGWDKNVGYPTCLHREAIQKYGPTVHHRRSFKLLT